MKQIIKLSEKSSIKGSISQLDKILLNHNDNSEFDILYDQAKLSIKELIEKARGLSKTGTTIHILKEIKFHDLTLVLSLDTPEKISLITKIMKYFKVS